MLFAAVSRPQHCSFSDSVPSASVTSRIIKSPPSAESRARSVHVFWGRGLTARGSSRSLTWKRPSFHVETTTEQHGRHGCQLNVVAHTKPGSELDKCVRGENMALVQLDVVIRNSTFLKRARNMRPRWERGASTTCG